MPAQISKLMYSSTGSGQSQALVFRCSPRGVRAGEILPTVISPPGRNASKAVKRQSAQIIKISFPVPYSSVGSYVSLRRVICNKMLRFPVRIRAPQPAYAKELSTLSTGFSTFPDRLRRNAFSDFWKFMENPAARFPAFPHCCYRFP